MKKTFKKDLKDYFEVCDFMQGCRVTWYSVIWGIVIAPVKVPFLIISNWLNKI